MKIVVLLRYFIFLEYIVIDKALESEIYKVTDQSILQLNYKNSYITILKIE